MPEHPPWQAFRRAASHARRVAGRAGVRHHEAPADVRVGEDQQFLVSTVHRRRAVQDTGGRDPPRGPGVDVGLVGDGFEQYDGSGGGGACGFGRRLRLTMPGTKEEEQTEEERQSAKEEEQTEEERQSAKEEEQMMGGRAALAAALAAAAVAVWLGSTASTRASTDAVSFAAPLRADSAAHASSRVVGAVVRTP